MEMTVVWKERKSKRSFPLFPHRLRKLANNRELPTFPQLRRRLGFLYLQARLTSTLTKSVTYMPGTFCYRHARSHPLKIFRALAPAFTPLPGRAPGALTLAQG